MKEQEIDERFEKAWDELGQAVRTFYALFGRAGLAEVLAGFNVQVLPARPDFDFEALHKAVGELEAIEENTDE